MKEKIKEKKVIEERFITFLKNKGIYDQFILNLDVNPPLEQFFKDSEFEKEFICSAFSWLNTPEKHDFWRDINDEWLETIKD